MSTLFAFPSKNQLYAQGAVTENPGTTKTFSSAIKVFFNKHDFYHMRLDLNKTFFSGHLKDIS